MTMRLIFNDTVRVPTEVAGLAGISRFGRLIYKRRRVATRLFQAAETAGIEQAFDVTSSQDLERLQERVGQRAEGGRYLYYPSNLVAPVDDARLALFLEKLRYADRNLRLDVPSANGWTGLLLLEADACGSFLDALAEGSVSAFMAANGAGFAPIENTVGLLDLRDYPTFLDYLTSNFEVRHFNSIVTDDRYTLMKRSRDKEKIRSEYRYFGALPDQVRRFFVQPFDFAESADTASYRMERVLIPDMALQWIHGSLTPGEFASFLDQVFHYLALRPTTQVGVAAGRARASSVYLDKLTDRIAHLKSLPVFDQLDRLVAGAGTTGGIDGLVARFRKLYATITRRDFGELAFGHGDLCFSNILYGKSAQLMKFIDPRGASDATDLYTDPYYDVAKLSHSVLGLYDYINNGMFTISVAGDLSLNLACDMADRGAEQQIFRQRLAEHGYDYRLTRLYEASLFLSMLPLHAEGPRKLAAFALTAGRILDELES
jgi:hypothetical protein